MRLRLGTRGSELARTQSGHVADALGALGHDVEVVVVRTEGDVRTGSLMREGGTGLFAAALREALLAGTVDLAVHSFKDLPTAAVPGLAIGAVPPREAAADVLCARDGLTLATLPNGARVGTGSPRRAAQLRLRRPDLVTVEIRGNVGTRLARVFGGPGGPGDLDAVVLARAGLARLGRLDAVTDVLDLVPAGAQGALAVECRADDAAVLAALDALDHAPTRAAVIAERTVLAALGAGCAAPIGVVAEVVDGALVLDAIVVSADASASIRTRLAGDVADPVALGTEVARRLLAEGAADVTTLSATRASRLAEFHDDHTLWSAATVPALVARRVLLPRADGPLAEGVRAAGAEVTCVPLTRRVAREVTAGGPPAAWVVLTSPQAVAALADAGVAPRRLGTRIAVVGAATADALARAGERADLVPCLPGRSGVADAATLVEVFAPGPGRVVIPGSELSKPTLADGLRAKGWTVDVVPTYTTVPMAEADADLRARWAAGHFDAVVLTAGSVAQAVVELLGLPPSATKVVAFGAPSATAASALGFDVAAVAPRQDAHGVVAALTEALERI